ncbi:SDR family NAD(P)-dependent oxidoreductase [Micromonospora sp. MA102]|uniref:SDR family NAD(P)-dependent oxidoreductase n=1 Tax=Micromonospora sp. MA102 TaxID=2952755 RepID=UPI0021C70DE9|nr:SDR family NAD(P)-dependent oxidoreductase [Micromonospora sp. MA102]
MAARVAVVTGGADGLGKRIATMLAERGDRVALWDVNADRLEATRAELARSGHDVLSATVDVADGDSVRAAVASVLSTWNRIDVGVSNAGVAPNQNLLEMAQADWQRVIDVNLNGTFHVTTAIARAMVERGVAGAICCIASGAAFSARPGAGAYCTSKAGVVMLAKSLAMEVGREGVRVNVVAPGFIDHGHREGLGDFVPPDYPVRMRAQTPLDHVGTPTDIADAVTYLCSDRAAFVTGAVLLVDGGSGAGKFNLPWS